MLRNVFDRELGISFERNNMNEELFEKFEIMLNESRIDYCLSYPDETLTDKYDLMIMYSAKDEMMIDLLYMVHAKKYKNVSDDDIKKAMVRIAGH